MTPFMTRNFFIVRTLWRERPAACLLLLAALLLSVALFRPKLPMQERLVHALLVIDVTQSMNVPDGSWSGAAISRGELARRAAAELLTQLPCGSRIGLGIFNEYRTFVLLAPMEVCANFNELNTTLNTIGNRMSWAGASEIAKGINSGLQTVEALPDHPAFVMFTDGHESPPISLLHRPNIISRPGEFSGLLAGVGSLHPSPIPKLDPDGNPIGFWKADEVAQTDIYSQGRNGSVEGEALSEEGGASTTQAKPPGAGQEHLSALHEDYLKDIAAQTGLGYLHVVGPGQLHEALLENGAAKRTLMPGDGRWLVAALALLAIVLSYTGLERLKMFSWRQLLRRRAL
jgi:mxaL protein